MRKKKNFLDKLVENEDMQYIADFTVNDNVQDWILGVEEGDRDDDELGKLKE